MNILRQTRSTVTIALYTDELVDMDTTMAPLFSNNDIQHINMLVFEKISDIDRPLRHTDFRLMHDNECFVLQQTCEYKRTSLNPTIIKILNPRTYTHELRKCHTWTSQRIDHGISQNDPNYEWVSTVHTYHKPVDSIIYTVRDQHKDLIQKRLS